ncbi:ABC transporter permease [Kordiimonas aestuarii]|uniref:ABC transporter permease n=1 Tax=Kordiimonas aestuarii TaxID=1005925 RepID=UPI0021D025F6|nr:ABC transporter permease [Kordiimonas aestuarii]
MFRNYLKTAMRNLLRNKLFSFINIAGLAIGLAAFILITLFVRDEFSWDRHWSGADDIYRMEMTYTQPGQVDRKSPNAVDPLKDIFLNTFPEVEAVSRYLEFDVGLRQGDAMYGQRILFADHNFLDFFNVRFVEGSREAVFSDLGGAVISQRTAEKYFGTASALGKSLTLHLPNGDRDFYVAGVVENPKRDSVIQHDFLVPFNRDYFTGMRWFTEDWRFAARTSFVRFAPGTNVDAIRAAMPDLVERHMPKGTDSTETGTSWSVDVDLVKLGDVHLYGNGANGDAGVLYGFLGIAFLILLIAVVNFLNLSMARTAHRAREVAVRKVLGAARGHVIQQFLAESVLLGLVALLIALAMVELALPYYNAFLSTVLELNLMSEPVVALLLLVLGIGVGLSAGSLQALYFAMLKPRDVLYSSTSADNGTGRLRQVLVVTQFAISAGLMIIAFFVNQQTQFARALDLGFNPDNLLVVARTNNDQGDTFKRRLLASPYITAIGRSSDVPTQGSEDRMQVRPITGDDTVTIDGLPSGPDFFRVYQIPLLAGRYLEDMPADITRARGEEGEYRRSSNIIINALAAKRLGFESPQAAIGQLVAANLTRDLRVDTTIVGVVADFHFDSARDVIRPGIYYTDEYRQSDMTVRYDPANKAAALDVLNETWRATYPDSILEYTSMEDMVERQYQTDARLGEMLTMFTLLAVTISAMGLYGLASFTAERRTKEIGIRKVLGARLRDIVGLFLWQFSKPILLANLIAWPVAFFFLDDWLDGFAYRIDLSLLPFVGAACAALAIGWLTVAGRAYVVARTNPINALRHE